MEVASAAFRQLAEYNHINNMRHPRQKKPLLLLFIGGSFILGSIVVLGADTYAHIAVADKAIFHAFFDRLQYYFIAGNIGLCFLILPFIATGTISAIKSKNTRHGYCLFTCGHLPIVILYISGFTSSQYALHEHAWTASALSIGLLPFFSVPLIGIGLLVGNCISKLLDKILPI